MSRTLRFALVPLVSLLAVTGHAGASAVRASSDSNTDRVQASIAVLQDLMKAPDKEIPRRLLARAEAIIVIPSLVKGGFVIGAEHGRGVISVRNGDAWSDPGFVTMTGGSIGWQIGVESVDMVFLVMNRQGVDDLLRDKVTFGGALAVAAGPVGRNANFDTDAKISSEILAYSRADGLFAGATLEGASLQSDHEANHAFYGPTAGLREIVGSTATTLHAPEVASTWCATLHGLTGPTSDFPL